MHARRLTPLAWLLMLGMTLALPTSASEVPASSRAAIWRGEAVSEGADFAHEIGAIIERAGWSIEYLDSLTLTNVTRLRADRHGLLVLPGARRLPVESIAAIQAYLEHGGDLIALGLPAWETPVFRCGDRWMTRPEYVAALNAQPPSRLLIEFVDASQGTGERSPAAGAEAVGATVSPATLSRWTRHAFRGEVGAVREVVREGERGALRVALDRLEGWDTLEPPSQAWAFPPGHTLTCFRAKGSANTRQLAVEWIEEDGSRWIATVDLASEWRRYALPPAEFKPWQPPTGRGRTGDGVNLARLARFTVGLALTHTSVEPGPQEYWFADLGTAPNPFGDAAPPVGTVVPRFESLAPDYMCYPVGTAVTVRPPRWQALLPAGDASEFEWTATNRVALASDSALLGLHPRPRGVGFNQGRPWRWQPLLVARDAATQEYRGAVAAMVAHVQPPYRGGVWALFTPSDPAFYRQVIVSRWLEDLVRRLRTPVFLHEGGSEFFTLFPAQAVTLGARAVNLGENALTNLQVLLSVIDQRQSKLTHRHREPITVAAGGTVTVTNRWAPAGWSDQGCVVAAQLLADDRVIDELYHELNRWEPRVEPEYLNARDGALWLAGERWKAHGVNYMPSSGIGVASEHFEYWLGRGAYDPEVVERDLRRIKAIGFNAISAFVYHRDLAAQHLLDLLFRCERLALKVNLSLRPGTPMDFRWSEMKALIEYYRLAENDTVMAYDLAWEPSHYDHRHQQRAYTQAWGEWVRRRYGSTTEAAKAWGEGPGLPAVGGAPADNASFLPVPPMAQLTQDGPWRKRVADYRAFLDELLAAKYAEARRLVRSVDPHHLVSFRMQHAGDPTYNAEGMLPYDFYGLRDAVDLWEPEAYGRIGDWNQVRPGHFTAAYARLCDATKPLLWAELGYNVWDGARRAPGASRLEFAARYYRDFYRLLRESGADGVFFWWYPGGFRLNENSDFGLINPDGTDRSVTRVIREEEAAFRTAPKPSPPTHWIAVDRDGDARGLHGLYERTKSEYWRVTEAGGQVGLRWARTPGSR